jgi:hypothetical protein
MNANIIRAIQQAGFSVYMRSIEDTWLHFTDGENIGYLQNDRLGGLSISTVHVPNYTSGTGFKIAKGLSVDDIRCAETLKKAFAMAPAWALSSSVASVKKWKSLDAFLSAGPWNRGFRLVNEQEH